MPNPKGHIPCHGITGLSSCRFVDADKEQESITSSKSSNSKSATAAMSALEIQLVEPHPVAESADNSVKLLIAATSTGMIDGEEQESACACIPNPISWYLCSVGCLI